MQRSSSSSSKRSKIFLTHHNAAVKDTADNGCSCAGRLGQRHSPGVQGRIAVVVGEVEARHLEAAVVLLRPVVLVSSISRVYQVANLTAVGHQHSLYRVWRFNALWFLVLVKLAGWRWSMFEYSSASSEW